MPGVLHRIIIRGSIASRERGIEMKTMLLKRGTRLYDGAWEITLLQPVRAEILGCYRGLVEVRVKSLSMLLLHVEATI